MVAAATDHKARIAVFSNASADLKEALFTFEETWRGRIAPGYAADLTVFRSDPMTAPAKDIPKIATVMTIVDGRIVQSPAAPERRP